eukprot:1160512-Pelagomonas_calceolata.AAC.11
MPQKEAHMLHDEVAARLYKRLLREAVTSGKSASSPLCKELLTAYLNARSRHKWQGSVEVHEVPAL